jgi:Putative transposase.
MSAGLEVADVFRHHGEAYRLAHAGHLGRVERRVMSAIELCRTAALGGHTEQCEDCGIVRIAYNSCRNRHCPKCQGAAREDWLAARAAELLPVPYFHVVFTLPAPAAEIAFQNKEMIYTILFKAAAEALRKIAADPKHLGAEIGVLAVLHTWGQTLHHHPHIHCVVPGGGPSPDGARWIDCRPGFFLSVRVLSRLFRRLFLENLQAAFEAGRLSFFGLSPSSALQPSLLIACTSFGGSIGWSTPSGPSAGPSRCSPISAATPTASRSPTAGWYRWRTARLPSAGRTTAIMPSPSS